MDVNQRLTLQLPHPPLGYPYGLTPYRYQCLTPHLPPPPPGDPTDPNFHRFDPAGTVLSPQKSGSNETDSQPTTQINTPITANASHTDVSQYLSNTDYPPSDTNDAAFQSLSALLAASREYEAGHGGPGH
jgi:hypothetical protein